MAKESFNNSLNKNKKIIAIILSAAMALSGGIIGGKQILKHVDEKSNTTSYSDTKENPNNEESTENEFTEDESTNKESTENESTNEEETESMTEEETHDNDEEIDYLYERASMDIAVLMDDLGVTDLYDTFFIFNELLNKGVFSKDGKFENKNYDNVSDIPIAKENTLGYNVLLGEGSCAIISDLFYNVAKMQGYEIYAVPCNFQENKNDLDYSEPNHQIVIANYENEVTYLDSTNNVIFDKYEDNEKYLLTPNKNYYLSVLPEKSVPSSDYLVTYNSKDDIREINNWIKNDNSTLSNEQIEQAKKNAANIIKENENIIEDFKVKYEDDVLKSLVYTR